MALKSCCEERDRSYLIHDMVRARNTILHYGILKLVTDVEKLLNRRTAAQMLTVYSIF
jgi:hypothetical protein